MCAQPRRKWWTRRRPDYWESYLMMLVTNDFSSLVLLTSDLRVTHPAEQTA